MSFTPLVDVHFSEHMTRCEFLDEMLSSQSDLRVTFRYLIGRAKMYPEVELVLDFRNVNYVSANFVGQLMDLRHHVVANKGSLRLVQMNRQVFEILLVSRVNQCFDIDFKDDFGMQFVEFAHKVSHEAQRRPEGWATRLRTMITESNLFDLSSPKKIAQLQKQMSKRRGDDHEPGRRVG
ncbi:MAG: STAS domain-containing protein [Phycisphaeraceae bacterium JB051]